MTAAQAVVPPAVDVQLRPAQRFPVLDTLRAVGAIAVLTTHTSFQSGAYLGNGVWGTLLARMDVGVALFFVLSGFLLARPWIARAADGVRGPSTRRYYEKRLLRIYPIYLLAAVVALAWVPDNDGAGWRSWLSTLLLADPYTTERLPHGLTQMWSLTAEMAFYAVLPLLMWSALPRSRALRPIRVWAVVLAMVATNVVWTLAVADPLQQRVAGSPGLWLPAFLSWFAVGIALALLQVQHERGSLPRWARFLRDLARMPGVCWTIVGGLLLVAATPVAGPVMFQVGTHGQLLTKHLLYAVVGGLMVLTGVFAERTGTYARVMSWAPLRHLGHISYGVFSLHLLVLAALYGATDYTVFAGDGLEVWAITLVLSLAAAELVYRLVEVPVDRVSSRLRREESTASTPSRATQAARTR